MKEDKKEKKEKREKKEKKDKKEKKEKRVSSLELPFKKKRWTNPNASMRGQHRSWPHLKQVLQTENYSKLPADIPSYPTIEASASVIPARKYCDLTGFVAPYTDPRTNIRYASAEVYQFIHRYLTADDIHKYLTLRNAQPRLK